MLFLTFSLISPFSSTITITFKARYACSSARRRGKNTTRRREGVGVVIDKNEESRRNFNKNSCDLLIAITHTEILVALYKTI